MGETVPEKARAAIRHGGNLGRARLMFPEAPAPWIDLSTGINPHSYPHSAVPASAFTRLPEPDAAEELKQLAAAHFGAPSARHVTLSPGTQMLMPLLAQIALARGAKSGAVLSPAYAEHARTARMAGLAVTELENTRELSAHDYAVVVNPNNPDGRITDRAALLSLAEAMRDKGGLLVVDEAFIETGGGAESLANAASQDALVILRSFGKFYGMAGVRLGFAIAQPDIAAELEARLGPWAVSGPALHIATQALADGKWQSSMRLRLAEDTRRMNDMLEKVGLAIAGGTSLFTLARNPRATELFSHLGQHGILVRIFDERPNDVRFGLPGSETEWQRLEEALSSFGYSSKV
ncbi:MULTISPECIES: threonine-phosphate decarboxylase CobD [Agrobacterium tumefaciens complex]|uniref:threonine-phosphate decarboxylase CobD n=1 Tax=Agrobacterium tumefaciens complex TaxID=1183400 RepID=UPI000DDA8AAC|nr:MULTISPECIES: threonine-phosphate decarboxylase CobD [Agrobacterium tumefaciens complex]MBB4408225.1 cobalamin biosynthetic protein CobC [Agrobacterium radiobacter]MBB4453784.1 cobalamin biosynthetic protein CobC [Agrobacterium radiobacter]MDR6590574.1 cobalamin biosynthetic protein CobC [Agrobacterium tumefaciens]